MNYLNLLVAVAVPVICVGYFAISRQLNKNDVQKDRLIQLRRIPYEMHALGDNRLNVLPLLGRDIRMNEHSDRPQVLQRPFSGHSPVRCRWKARTSFSAKAGLVES